MNIKASTKSGNFAFAMEATLPADPEKKAAILSHALVALAEGVFPKWHKNHGDPKKAKALLFTPDMGAKFGAFLKEGLEATGLEGVSVTTSERKWSEAAKAASDAKAKIASAALELFTTLVSVGVAVEVAEAKAKALDSAFVAPKAEEPAPVEAPDVQES